MGRERGKPLPQFLHSQADPRLDGSGWNPQSSRDFNMAQAGKIGEQKAFALYIAEPRNSFPNQALSLIQDGEHLGIVSLIGQVVERVE
jgi:hypothetical protein